MTTSPSTVVEIIETESETVAVELNEEYVDDESVGSGFSDVELSQKEEGRKNAPIVTFFDLDM